MTPKLKKGDTKTIKKIYVPTPYDEYDDHECEEPEPPAWHRYFEPDELLARYEPIRQLGRGAYALVYEGKVLNKHGQLDRNIRVAIKKVRRVFHTETDAKRLLRELRILRILRKHNNIVTLYDIIPPKEPRRFTTLTLIFEFVDADLSKLFRTNQFLKTLHVQYMLYQILSGIKYMHSAKIVHRDLKPANILINEDCSIKICDFALARGLNEESKQKQDATDDTKTEEDITSEKSRKRRALLKKKKKPSRRLKRRVLTRWYRAPETLLLQETQETLCALDIWSVGAIFAELLQMQRENRPDPCKRGPIFPGDPCFLYEINDTYYSSYGMDQMQNMFDVIGSPNESEINKITDERARKYLRNLPQRKQKNLRTMFPGADKHALDLFIKLLKFDANKRISADEALEHPYFKLVRDNCDIAHTRSKKAINFFFESAQLNQKKLRELILEEVIRYNKDSEERFIKSGSMPNYKRLLKKQADEKTPLIVNGYIRFKIKMEIPMDLVFVVQFYYRQMFYSFFI